MQRLLTRIRHRLINEGKMKKYLLYAIGEIFLIVMGILIALQLNEWKEKRNNLRTEIKILSEIREDLRNTELDFTEGIEFDGEVIKYKQVIIDVIDNDILWNDSLQTYFTYFNWWHTYTINSTAYHSLENWGINNISSDSLKRQIVYVFQTCVTNLENAVRNEDGVRLGKYQDLLALTFDWSDIYALKPFDYEEFLKNEELSAYLKSFKMFTIITLNIKKEILEDIKSLRQNLITEIERLEKL